MASLIYPGLCATCRHVAIMRSDRGSIFVRCALSETNPRFAKYPRLPVLECTGWKPEVSPVDDKSLSE
jgi:hypothetical protein